MITHVPRSCENPGESEADMHTGSYYNYYYYSVFLCVKRIFTTHSAYFTTHSAYFTSSKCAGLITNYCEQDANPMHVLQFTSGFTLFSYCCKDSAKQINQLMILSCQVRLKKSIAQESCGRSLALSTLATR